MALIHRFRTRIRSMIECMLKNTHDYFLCFYPGNSGYFIRKLIQRLVNKLNFDEHNIEKIKNLPCDSIIVYACKNKNTLDFIYYHTKLKSLDLPYPQIGFDFRFFFLLPVKRLLRFFLSQADYFFHHFHGNINSKVRCYKQLFQFFKKFFINGFGRGEQFIYISCKDFSCSGQSGFQF